jgi:tripartite-type tricarboxylate transporter receptor subunit TctC
MGYTLLLTTSADAWNATLYSNLNFNVLRDFTPVATISRGPGITQRIAELGDAPLSLSTSDFAKLVVAETEKWRKVIAAGNVRAE